jgi:hypothetical protein
MNLSNIDPTVLAECRLLRNLGLGLRRRAFQSLLARRASGSMGLPKKVNAGKSTDDGVAKPVRRLKRIDMAA